MESGKKIATTLTAAVAAVLLLYFSKDMIAAVVISIIVSVVIFLIRNKSADAFRDNIHEAIYIFMTVLKIAAVISFYTKIGLYKIGGIIIAATVIQLIFYSHCYDLFKTETDIIPLLLSIVAFLILKVASDLICTYLFYAFSGKFILNILINLAIAFGFAAVNKKADKLLFLSIILPFAAVHSSFLFSVMF